MSTIPLDVARNNAWSSDVVIRRISDVKAEPINWLWKDRIARGKVSMIAGDPGLGKSQLTALMASIVSRGGTWPVDKTPCPKGSVIFLSAEDDAADTIRPRLEAVEADIYKVWVLDAIKEQDSDGKPIQRCFNLKSDLERLGQLLEKLDDVALVIIDPISAYLGGTDSHKNSDIRALLSPLSDLASKYQTAFICVTHLNKGQSKQALQRVTGSGAFVAAARAAYVVAKDQDTPERRLFLPIKNNIGDDLSGFAFSIQSVQLDSRIETSKIVFEDMLITASADEMLSPEIDDGEKTAIDEAMEFLEDTLGHLGLSYKNVEKLARNAGVSVRTLRRAKDRLGVQSIKEGPSWIWKFPENKEDVQDGRANEMDTLATLNKNTDAEDDEERLAIQQFDGGQHD